MFSQTVDVLVTDLRGVDIDRGLLSVSELWSELGCDTATAKAQTLAANCWLRQRVAEYLRRDPGELRLAKTRSGDRAVLWPVSDLDISFAKAGWMATLAVGFRRELGVSIEAVTDGPLDEAAVLGAMTPAERQLIDRSHDPVRAFSKMRVRKEALARALTGVVDVSKTDVSGLAPVSVSGLEITDLHFGNDLVAAIANPSHTTLSVAIDHVGHATQPDLAAAPA